MSSSVPPAVTPGRLAVRARRGVRDRASLVALQTRINGELGQRLGDGFLAAFISFGSGFVILALASLVWRPGRRGITRVVTALRERSIPWWLVLGGVGGRALRARPGAHGRAARRRDVHDRRRLRADRELAPARSPRARAHARDARHAASGSRGRCSRSSRSGSRCPTGSAPTSRSGRSSSRSSPGCSSAGSKRSNGQVPGGRGVRRSPRPSATSSSAPSFWGSRCSCTSRSRAGTRPSRGSGGSTSAGYNGCLFIAAQAVIVRTTGVLLMGLALLAGQLGASVLFDPGRARRRNRAAPRHPDRHRARARPPS